MSIFLYYDSYAHEVTPGIPILTEGYDDRGNKYWFYIAPQTWSLTEPMIPYIIYHGKQMYVRKGSRSVVNQDEFVQLHTHLKQNKVNTYTPGEVVTFDELLRILDECGLETISSTSTRIIYTLFTNPSFVGSYGRVSLEPYVVNSDYKWVNFGPSNKYTGFSLIMLSDDYLICKDWSYIANNIYEQIIRGLSSSGNWEILSDGQYGSYFRLKSGWGYQKITINDDIIINFTNIVLEKNKKNFIISQIQREVIDLARIIAPRTFSSGALTSVLHSHIDWKKYDTLFKNAGIQD